MWVGPNARESVGFPVQTPAAQVIAAPVTRPGTALTFTGPANEVTTFPRPSTAVAVIEYGVPATVNGSGEPCEPVAPEVISTLNDEIAVRSSFLSAVLEAQP